MARKPNKIKNKKVKGKNLLGQADCQRLGFDCDDIAKADKESGIKQNLFKYFQKHPKLRDSFDRGRMLRALAKTAPNSLIYEAARRLKDLGFTQFQTAQDLRNFLDKDVEANELWESARVNAAIDNRENLRKAAGEGNVKAIELLDKWTIDRQKETGESGSANFNRISTNQMAELFGVTRQSIYEWNTQKGLSANLDGTYDLYNAIKWFGDFTVQKIATKSGPVILNPKEAVKTELAKLELQEKKGEMVGRNFFINWRILILKTLKGKMDDIISIANNIYGQPRETIVNILEKYRDELYKCIRDMPDELKLNDAVIKSKLQEVYSLITNSATDSASSPQAEVTESTEK